MKLKLRPQYIMENKRKLQKIFWETQITTPLMRMTQVRLNSQLFSSLCLQFYSCEVLQGVLSLSYNFISFQKLSLRFCTFPSVKTLWSVECRFVFVQVDLTKVL